MVLAKELIHHATLCFVLVLTFKQPWSGLCNIICGLKSHGRTYLSQHITTVYLTLNILSVGNYLSCGSQLHICFWTRLVSPNHVSILIHTTSRKVYIQCSLVLYWIKLKRCWVATEVEQISGRLYSKEIELCTCSKYDNRFKFTFNVHLYWIKLKSCWVATKVEWISGRHNSIEIELHAQNMITVLSSVVNIIEGERIYDHLKRCMIIFTLKFNEMFISLPKFMRKLATALIQGP